MPTEKMMPPIYQTRYDTLLEQLQNLEGQLASLLVCTRQCRDLTKVALKELRCHIEDHPPATTTEEIIFFKHVKPAFYMLYLYYDVVNTLELHMPVGSLDAQKSYLTKQLDKLGFFYEDHRNFYDYYRTADNKNDVFYFTRGNLWENGDIPAMFLSLDTSFCTGYDVLLAQIQANDRLNIFIAERLYQLEHPDSASLGQGLSKFKWTASNVDLAELVYGLIADGAVDNGHVPAQTFSRQLGNFFGINMDSVSKKFEEIRTRKKNRTTFWDRGKRSLIRKMEEDDEHAL